MRFLILFILLLWSPLTWAGPFDDALYQIAREQKQNPTLVSEDVARFLTNFDSSDPNRGWREAMSYLDLGRSLPQGQADFIVFFPYDPERSAELHPMAIRRLDECIRLYKAGLAPKIMITGNAPNPNGIVATTVRYLNSKGIPDAALEFEDIEERKTLSGNTYQNVEFGLQAIAKLGGKSAILVSSPYHMERIFRYYDKAIKLGEPALTKVYWSSYGHFVDNDLPAEKRRNIQHEIFGVIRDHSQFENDLLSPQMQSKLEGRSPATAITLCQEMALGGVGF